MYNETMLEESPAHLQKVETTFNKINQLRPELIDVFGNQLHVFANAELTEEQKKAHEIKNSLELLKGQQLMEANPNQTYETQQNNLQSPVNQAPIQTNGKQKTLGCPAMKQNNSNTNGSISTFIITFGVLISGLVTICLNLLV